MGPIKGQSTLVEHESVLPSIRGQWASLVASDHVETVPEPHLIVGGPEAMVARTFIPMRW